MDTRDFVGVSVAAAFLRLHRSRVHQFARQGRIGTLVAGRYLFTRQELAAFSHLPRPTGKPTGSRKKSKVA